MLKAMEKWWKKVSESGVDITPSMGVEPGAFTQGISAQEIRDLIDEGVKNQKENI